MTTIAFILFPVYLGFAIVAFFLWAIGQFFAFIVVAMIFSFKGARHLYYAAKVAWWRRGTKGL